MTYSRRKFIGTAAAGMGAMLLDTRSTRAVQVPTANYDPYETVELGKTGIKTTLLCMGTGINGSNRQSDLIRTGYDRGVELVREAYNRGVRMFDSGDIYGTHGVMYDALKTYPREDYVLISKIWFRRGALPEAERPNTEMVVARFLRELHTDYIDGVQLHCVETGSWNTELSDHMTALDKLKQRGVIRSHGVSCHSLAAMETAVNEAWVDTIHVRINAYGSHMDDSVEKVEPVVKQLHQAGKGVIAMKVLGQGAFVENESQKENSFRYVLQLGAVNVLSIGINKSGDIVDTESCIRKVGKLG